jgi:hypothetical protein
VSGRPMQWDVSQALALRQQGLSLSRIGPELGVTGSAVIQYFRLHPELSSRVRDPQPDIRRRCQSCERLSDNHTTCPGCGDPFEVVV